MKWIYALIIVPALILSACSQSADIYFYSDESWKVSSRITFDRVDLQVIKLLDEQLKELNLPVSTDQIAGGLSESGLEMLRSQYASVGIDLRVSGVGSSRALTARGKTLDQFNRLLPGVMTVTQESEDRYRLQAEFTEGMILTSAVYHLNINLHAGKIYSSDAVRQSGGSAQWINPPRIDATFAPITEFPWGILLGVCAAGLLAAVPFAALYGKQKCPNCGRRVSKKAEYCPNCGEPMEGTSSGGNYF
mgnify:CR=1 FL=1